MLQNVTQLWSWEIVTQQWCFKVPYNRDLSHNSDAIKMSHNNCVTKTKFLPAPQHHQSASQDWR